MTNRQIKVSQISDLGAIVRDERRRQGLKQAEAAGLLGVGVRFLSELERGKDSLEIGKVLQVIEGLGLAMEIRVNTSAPLETADQSDKA